MTRSGPEAQQSLTALRPNCRPLKSVKIYQCYKKQTLCGYNVMRTVSHCHLLSAHRVVDQSISCGCPRHQPTELQYFAARTEGRKYAAGARDWCTSPRDFRDQAHRTTARNYCLAANQPINGHHSNWPMTLQQYTEPLPAGKRRPMSPHLLDVFSHALGKSGSVLRATNGGKQRKTAEHTENAVHLVARRESFAFFGVVVSVPLPRASRVLERL